MSTRFPHPFRSALLLLLLPLVSHADPLPSWNDTAAKQAIVAFVERVTTPGSPDYVDPAARIATFDNDGTLWSEQPAYFQLLFAVDRIKALAPEHPEWATEEPFASILRDGLTGVLAEGEAGVVKFLAATHAGTTTADFDAEARAWINSAKHPVTGQPIKGLIFQPMLELLTYLRAEGFKTFIVSGGGIDFIRAFADELYGIPPEQVVGSTGGLRYEVGPDGPVIVKLAELVLNDDKENKPVGIQRHIGRRPIFAAGNSDGDFQMLEWTTTAPGLRFAMIVHHDDATREAAYDRNSAIGRLARGLDEGPDRGWLIVSMAQDWARVFP